MNKTFYNKKTFIVKIQLFVILNKNIKYIQLPNNLEQKPLFSTVIFKMYKFL